MTFEQRLKGESHVAFWRKSTQGRGSSICKGPGVGVCLTGIGYSEEFSVDWSGISKVGSDRRQDGRGSQS